MRRRISALILRVILNLYIAEKENIAVEESKGVQEVIGLFRSVNHYGSCHRIDWVGGEAKDVQ